MEYWTVSSEWSPNDMTFYVGFENWDVFDSVGISVDIPEPDEKTDWIETATLLKHWKIEFKKLLDRIDTLRDRSSE